MSCKLYSSRQTASVSQLNSIFYYNHIPLFQWIMNWQNWPQRWKLKLKMWKWRLGTRKLFLTQRGKGSGKTRSLSIWSRSWQINCWGNIDHWTQYLLTTVRCSHDREVTDTRNEIRARYFDCKKKNAAVAERSIGAHSWKKVDEIFPRSLEDRCVHVNIKSWYCVIFDINS